MFRPISDANSQSFWQESNSWMTISNSQLSILNWTIFIWVWNWRWSCWSKWSHSWENQHMGGSFQQTMELMTPEHMMSCCKSSSPGPVNFRNDSGRRCGCTGSKKRTASCVSYQRFRCAESQQFSEKCGTRETWRSFFDDSPAPFCGSRKKPPVRSC